MLALSKLHICQGQISFWERSERSQSTFCRHVFELLPGRELKQENIHLEGAYFLIKKCQTDTGIVKLH